MKRSFKQINIVTLMIVGYLLGLTVYEQQLVAQIPDGGEGIIVTPKATPTPTMTAVPPQVCNPNVSAGVITFEEFNEFDNISDEPIRSTILQKYGVQFEAIKAGNFSIAKIANRGDSEPAFKAWASALCPGSPGNNRLCNGGNSGTRALSMRDAKDTREAELSLTFIETVQSISFDILDVDGGETWTITAIDKDGQALPSQTVSAVTYGDGSGNNLAKNFQVQTAGRLIKSLRIRGTKSINIFGFGFDNFVTGITPCQ